MKHVALVAAGLVGAVLLIQGTGSVVAAPGSDLAGITFAASGPLSSAATPTATPLALAQSSSKPGSSSSAASTSSSSSTDAATAPTTVKAAAAATTASSSDTSPGTVSSGRATSDTVKPTETKPVQTSTSTSQTSPSKPACPTAISGTTGGAPSPSSVDNIPGTTSADLQSFADEYNAIRVANCLKPIPFANIRYSSCLQDRLFWMADDPSTNPLSAWGHTGTAKRSDGVPIVGCDGDLAGGTGYSGASVAQAWWGSPDHRASLFQPAFTGNVASVCIYFAMSHGGYNVPAPNEPSSFTRAASYWSGC